MVNILLVCDNNWERSLAGHHIMRTSARIRGIEDRLNVNSAGLFQRSVMYMSKPMIDALEAEGFPRPGPHEYRSRYITEEDLTDVDLVLGFEDSHVPRVLELAEEFSQELKNKLEGRIYTPSRLIGPKKDIIAPGDLTGKVPGYKLFRMLPYSLGKELIYLAVGKTHYEDNQAVLKVHKKVVREIAYYTQVAMEKIINDVKLV